MKSNRCSTNIRLLRHATVQIQNIASKEQKKSNQNALYSHRMLPALIHSSKVNRCLHCKPRASNEPGEESSGAKSKEPGEERSGARSNEPGEERSGAKSNEPGEESGTKSNEPGEKRSGAKSNKPGEEMSGAKSNDPGKEKSGAKSFIISITST